MISAPMNDDRYCFLEYLVFYKKHCRNWIQLTKKLFPEQSIIVFISQKGFYIFKCDEK